jgi:transcriptional regulator with XRE-family HTH domain
MLLGEKIQQLRKEKGFSQEQLAAQITVSRQAISKWEIGESMPDIDNVIQLSKLFGVSTDFLLKNEITDLPMCGCDEDSTEAKSDASEKDTVTLRLSRLKSRTGAILVLIQILVVLLLWVLSMIYPVKFYTGDGNMLVTHFGLSAFLESHRLWTVWRVSLYLGIAGVVLILYGWWEGRIISKHLKSTR